MSPLGQLHHDGRQYGFSLLELIFVIVVIGILSVAVMPKWSPSGFNVNYEVRHLLNDIRYAQALAMTTGAHYSWVKLSSTTYCLQDESATQVILPSGKTVVTLSNVQFGTLTNLPNNMLVFDSAGIPYINSSGTVLATTATIPITASGTTRTVQINATTGFGAVT